MNNTAITYRFIPPQIANNDCNIRVIIKGISCDKGQMVIYLYKTKEGFPTRPDRVLKQFKAPISNKRSKLLIEHLAPGEYALSAFQDETLYRKGCCRLFRNTQTNGVSNNPKTSFIPSYDDAKFNLNEKWRCINIIIK